MALGQTILSELAVVFKIDGFATLEGSLKKATDLVKGFASAGVSASYVGQQLSFQYERIGRSIAGVLKPELEAVTKLVGRFADWLDSLSNKQRQSIVNWIAMAGGAALFRGLIPGLLGGLAGLTKGVFGAAGGFLKLFTSLQAIGGLVGSLFGWFGTLVGVLVGVGAGAEAAQVGFQGIVDSLKPLFDWVKKIGSEILTALNPAIEACRGLFLSLGPVISTLLQFLQLLVEYILKHLKPALELVAQGIGKIEQGINLITGKRYELKPLAAHGLPDRSPVPRRSGGFESVSAAYERVAALTASLGGGKGVEERQLDELKEGNRLHKEGNAAIKQLQPAIVR